MHYEYVEGGVKGYAVCAMCNHASPELHMKGHASPVRRLRTLLKSRGWAYTKHWEGGMVDICPDCLPWFRKRKREKEGR